MINIFIASILLSISPGTFDEPRDYFNSANQKLLALSPGFSNQKAPVAVLVQRCESACSYPDQVMEYVYTLMRWLSDRPPDQIAIRVCSKQPMNIALSTAAMEPDYIKQWLVNDYRYPSNRIKFLRSEDCLSQSEELAAAELWAIPSGAEFPQYVESLDACKFSRTPISPQPDLLPHYKTYPKYRTEQAYQRYLKRLIVELRLNPNAIGLILGFHDTRDEPSGVLKGRLEKAKNLLQHEGIEAKRYHIQTLPWQRGDFSTKEEWPAIYLVKMASECGNTK